MVKCRMCGKEMGETKYRYCVDCSMKMTDRLMREKDRDED
jgi:ribosomal protein L37E